MNIINEYKRQFPLGIENDDISDFEEYHCTKPTPFYHHNNIYHQSLNLYHHQFGVSSNPSLSQTDDESINFLNSSRASTTSLVKNYPPTYYTYSQRVDEAEGANIETKSSNTKDKILAKLNIKKRSSNLPVKNKDNKDNKDKPRTISAVGWDFNKDEEIRELTKRKNQLFGNESYKSSESEKSRSLSFMHNRKQRPAILDRSSLGGSQLGFPKRSMDSDKKSTSSLSGSSSTNYFFENIDDIGYLNKETFKSIGTPDFSGWLKKQGDKYKIWKTRYCILRGVNFYYFKNDKDIESSHVKGYINLTGYRIIPDENLLHGKYGFKLIHDTEKSHNFAHDDVDQIRGWMKAMMKATIVRDSKALFISSSNISTVPLSEAHKLTPHLPDPRRTSVNSVSLNKVTSPTLRPTSPILQPTSPILRPTSPILRPTSPTLRPVSPILRPTSPLSQRTVSPIPTRSLSPALQTLLNSTSP